MGIRQAIRVEKSPSAVLEIVNELRSLGYQSGQDFDFAYHPARVTDFDTFEVAYAHFWFYNESLASWFVLRFA